MPKINATTRLFLRTKPVKDPEGNLRYTFPEVPVSGVGNASLATREARVAARVWEIDVSLDGVRHGRLKQKDRHGAWHIRALRRIEEDHLMKFAIVQN